MVRIKRLNGTLIEVDIFDEVAMAAEFGSEFLPFLRAALEADPKPTETRLEEGLATCCCPPPNSHWRTAALRAYRSAKDAQRQHDCTESPPGCVCGWCTQVLGHWQAVEDLWAHVLALPEVEAARQRELAYRQQDWENRIYMDAALRATHKLGIGHLHSRGHFAVQGYHRQ